MSLAPRSASPRSSEAFDTLWRLAVVLAIAAAVVLAARVSMGPPLF